MSSELLKDYDLAEPTIRGLYDSRLRLAILDALKDGPMRLADLRRIVNANAPNASAKAKDLEDMGLLERIEGDFQITPWGNAVHAKTLELIEFYSTYAKFKEFWCKRDMGGIPTYLMTRLGELRNSEIVLDDPTNISSVDKRFYELINSSNVFWKGIFPMYDPQWSKLAMKAVSKGVKFDLIVTQNVLNGMKKSLKREERKTALEYGGITIRLLPEEPKVALAVTDKFFSINLKLTGAETRFREADMLSFDPRAIQWGLDLFEYYKKRAKPMKLSEAI